MNQYLVTEELNQIKNDCAEPERMECDGCKYWIETTFDSSDHDISCTFKGANDLMDEATRLYNQQVDRNTINACYSCPNFDVKLQSEREKLLDEVEAILDIRKSYMEELFEELRDPAVAKHSLQQIEIIRHRVDDLRGKKDGK